MPTIPSRWLRSLWRNGGLIAIFVVLTFQKDHWTSLWFRMAMTTAMIWLVAPDIVGQDLTRRMKIVCGVLVLAVSAAWWISGSERWRGSGVVVFLVVSALTEWFEPSRKAVHHQRGSWLT
jgi:hypothetical protein